MARPSFSRRARWIAAGIVLLSLLAIGLGAYLYERHRTGSVYHPNTRFLPEPTPVLPPSPADRFYWPFYGYTPDHSRFLPASAALHAPFRQLWEHDFGSLLEFPPVMGGTRLFQLADDAVLSAVDKRNGHILWQRRLGALSASAPGVVGNVVYATVLDDGHGYGRAVALRASTGAILWSRGLPSRSESSPLIDHGRVFFGSESGTVYALNAHNGTVAWSYHAAGAVKASPTLSGGVLYFGDYSGHVQAVSQATGRRLWRSGSEGAPLGSGTFYSTAAVLYGRVFLGNTDGRMYAYDASSGHLDWAVQTGAYVYASPALTNAAGLGPTVYFGSYDGTFYALNARSGRQEWSFHPGGRISGSATIVGRVVYFADLASRRTYGLGVSTGRPVFQFHSGSFDPVISDGHDLYLTGYSGLYGLAPR